MAISRELQYRAASIAPMRGRTMEELKYDVVYKGEFDEYMKRSTIIQGERLSAINKVKEELRAILADLEKCTIETMDYQAIAEETCERMEV